MYDGFEVWPENLINFTVSEISIRLREYNEKLLS